jgi:hypothetical protein
MIKREQSGDCGNHRPKRGNRSDHDARPIAKFSKKVTATTVLGRIAAPTLTLMAKG